MAPVYNILARSVDFSCQNFCKRHVRYWGNELRTPQVTTPNQIGQLKSGIVRYVAVYLTTLTHQIIIWTHWFTFIFCHIGLHQIELQDIAPSSYYTGEKWRYPTTINWKLEFVEKNRVKKNLRRLQA